MATAPTFQSFLKKKRHKFNKWNQVCSVEEGISRRAHKWYAHNCTHAQFNYAEMVRVAPEHTLLVYSKKRRGGGGINKNWSRFVVSTTLVSFGNLLYISSWLTKSTFYNLAGSKVVKIPLETECDYQACEQPTAAAALSEFFSELIVARHDCCAHAVRCQHPDVSPYV